MDQRLKRFLVSAVIILLLALVFLWGIHSMGHSIKTN